MSEYKGGSSGGLVVLAVFLAIFIMVADIVQRRMRETERHPRAITNDAVVRPPAVLLPIQEGWPLEVINARHRVEVLLDALYEHESVGGTQLVGDGGNARGPLHIHEAYWHDGCEEGKVLNDAGWEYATAVWDVWKSRQVAKWYWHRYCPQALADGDQEVLARVHNGGPRGAEKASTNAYWAKVQLVLASMRSATDK